MPLLIYYVRTFHASVRLSSSHSCGEYTLISAIGGLSFGKAKWHKIVYQEYLYGSCQFSLFLKSPELSLHSDPSKSLEIKKQTWLKDNRIVLCIFGIARLLLCLVAAKICWLWIVTLQKRLPPELRSVGNTSARSFSSASHNQIPFFTVFCNPTNWDHPKCYHELKSTSIKNPIYIPYENTWPSKVFDFHRTFSSVCHLKFRPFSIFLSNAASHGSLANELAK